MMYLMQKCSEVIMKISKNGYHFVNMHHKEKFQITDPPKFESLVFQVLTETEYGCEPL